MCLLNFIFFFTNKIVDYDLIKKLISDATQGLKLNPNLSKKVWMYHIKLNGTINQTILNSKGAVAKLLKVQHLTITNHLDKWIKGGINGN